MACRKWYKLAKSHWQWLVSIGGLGGGEGVNVPITVGAAYQGIYGTALHIRDLQTHFTTLIVLVLSCSAFSRTFCDRSAHRVSNNNLYKE